MLMRVCNLCNLFSSAEELGSEAENHTPKCVANMLAGAASFFACLHSFPSSLSAKITEHPYRALALAVGAIAVSVFGYRAWKKHSFDKALTDWINEVPIELLAIKLEREATKRAIEAYQKTSEKQLNLSGRALTSLPNISIFQSLPHLKKLNLSGNSLKTIPEESERPRKARSLVN